MYDHRAGLDGAGEKRVAGAFGYWRETGKFILFEAPAVVLATGGIGKSFKVSSNSWEYTGDGHALALRAGSALINMEFIQFHPTGMVWPLSVKGILVTEGVRGDGGVLKNSEGKRFMFDYVPSSSGRSTPRPKKKPTSGSRTPTPTRRTPDLLPRDEVARAINSEVKAGRGTPHGGVFLDIASRLPRRGDQRRLPSMYHQFKELADVDITKEPMEVGPTCHYVMGGVEVDPDTGGGARARAVRRRRGLGRHARLEPARRQLAVATCWCSAGGPATVRPNTSGAGAPARTSPDADVDGGRRRALAPFEARGRREPVHDPPGTAADDERPGRHHPQGGRGRQALAKLEGLKAA